MVQAFGREAEVRERFGERAQGVRASSLREAGVEARYLPGPHLPALDGDRERALLRRARRHRREPDDRPVRALQQPAAAARVAARGARLDPQPRPARDRLGQPRVRVARCRAAAAGGRAARRSCPRAGSTCASRTSASPTRAARPCSATSTSRSRPATIVAVCGETGSGKSTMLNLLSRFYDPDSGSVRVGGDRGLGAAQGRPAHGRRARHAAAGAVLAAAAREPLRRAARGDGGGDARRLRGRRRGVVHRRPARRLRHADRRARRQPLGRPAPARRARARADLERARARARRPALGGRHRDRGADRAPAAARARRAAPCCSRASASRRSRWPTAPSCSRTA